MNEQPSAVRGALPASPLHQLLAVFRRAIASDPGTVAALRRADPCSPPAVFYRLTAHLLDEHMPEVGPLRDAYESRWVVIASAMASAKGLPESGPPLGEALAKAGVSEMRVVRLLEAEPGQLPDLIRHAVQQLTQKGQAFDPIDLAYLVLSAGTDRARRPRRSIARDFYRHQKT